MPPNHVAPTLPLGSTVISATAWERDALLLLASRCYITHSKASHTAVEQQLKKELGSGPMNFTFYEEFRLLGCYAAWLL
jgi:hypothetical protein